jgi:2-haloacid dehalogenase
VAFDVKPKFATFNMNGTLIKFSINDAIREVLGDRLPAEIADAYLRICKAHRIDECMGDYQPFHQIVARSMERASRWVGLEYREEDARAVYEIIPTWGPTQGHRGTEQAGRGSPAGHHHQQRHRARGAPRGKPQGPRSRW